MAPKPGDIWGVPLPDPKDVVDYLNNAVSQARTASGDSQAKPGTSDFDINVE